MATLSTSTTPRAGGAERIAVRRSDLEAALAKITIAYENAVSAADEGLIDFASFDMLPEAIQLLRALLREAAR